ncbi:MAG: hypothetical protein J0I29_12300 [Rhizobiales bacterium]|nr:hypothetical protein [Hyphomicrobiales bacterium]
MNKALAALAIAAFVGAGMAIFPSFAPSANANPQMSGTPAQKSVAWADPACASQNWPNFDPSCLNSANPKGISQVRTVTTDRL